MGMVGEKQKKKTSGEEQSVKKKEKKIEWSREPLGKDNWKLRRAQVNPVADSRVCKDALHWDFRGVSKVEPPDFFSRGREAGKSNDSRRE